MKLAGTVFLYAGTIIGLTAAARIPPHYPLFLICLGILILGILILLAGISIFAIGIERCKNIINYWQDKPENMLRLLSLIALVIGVAVLYCA